MNARALITSLLEADEELDWTPDPADPDETVPPGVTLNVQHRGHVIPITAAQASYLKKYHFISDQDKVDALTYRLHPLSNLADLDYVLRHIKVQEAEEDKTDWTPDPRDPDELSIDHATDHAKAGLIELNRKEWQVGFSITTSNEHTIRERLSELGVADTHDIWRGLSGDIWRLEANALRLLSENGFPYREEGHDDDSVGGSLWIQYVNKKAFKMAQKMINLGEYWGTGNGYIHEFDGSNTLFKNVSELGQRVLDVDIRIHASDEQKEEIEDL